MGRWCGGRPGRYEGGLDQFFARLFTTPSRSSTLLERNEEITTTLEHSLNQDWKKRTRAIDDDEFLRWGIMKRKRRILERGWRQYLLHWWMGDTKSKRRQKTTKMGRKNTIIWQGILLYASGKHLSTMLMLKIPRRKDASWEKHDSETQVSSEWKQETHQKTTTTNYHFINAACIWNALRSVKTPVAVGGCGWSTYIVEREKEASNVYVTTCERIMPSWTRYHN